MNELINSHTTMFLNNRDISSWEEYFSLLLYDSKWFKKSYTLEICQHRIGIMLAEDFARYLYFATDTVLTEDTQIWDMADEFSRYIPTFYNPFVTAEDRYFWHVAFEKTYLSLLGRDYTDYTLGF